MADSPAIDHSLVQGIVIYRWLALAWAIAGMVIWRSYVEDPGQVSALLAVAFVFTVVVTVLSRGAPGRVLRLPVIITELLIAASLLVADGFVHDVSDTADPRPQSLPWAWPAAAIISTAVAFGRRAGLVVALLLAAASWVGESQVHEVDKATVAIASRTGLYVLAAVAAGGAAHRIRAAEQEISTVRAREEMGRDLHDGVLQTLAVIQRRVADPELSDLARDQERDLRNYLFGAAHSDDEPTSIPIALRESAAMVDRRFGGRTQVVVVDDLPEVSDGASHALVGAATEAMTNAAKHANASKVVVFVEPTDDDKGVFCSIKDDGQGFDLARLDLAGPGRSSPEAGGEGLRRSISQRMEEMGGTVEIESHQGRGTEVRLWVR